MRLTELQAKQVNAALMAGLPARHVNFWLRLPKSTASNYAIKLGLQTAGRQGLLALPPEYAAAIRRAGNAAFRLASEKKRAWAWSMRYPHCQKCGTTKVKHARDGICMHCYARQAYRDKKKGKGVCSDCKGPCSTVSRRCRSCHNSIPKFKRRAGGGQKA